MTTRVGAERKARFLELARRAFAPSSWSWRRGAYVARVSLWIGLVLTLVGSIARWGSLAVGLTLLALALGLAFLDEIATYHRERQRAPEPEEVEE